MLFIIAVLVFNAWTVSSMSVLDIHPNWPGHQVRPLCNQVNRLIRLLEDESRGYCPLQTLASEWTNNTRSCHGGNVTVDCKRDILVQFTVYRTTLGQLRQKQPASYDAKNVKNVMMYVINTLQDFIIYISREWSVDGVFQIPSVRIRARNDDEFMENLACVTDELKRFMLAINISECRIDV